MKWIAPVVVSFCLAAVPLLAGGQGATGVPEDPAAPGYLDLRAIPGVRGGPDEFGRVYSVTMALERVEQIRGFLNSFSRLTEQARGRLTQAQRQAIGNMGPEMQSIGFNNIPLMVEGTLLKQDYLLMQARYELAGHQYEQQRLSEGELAQAEAAYREATAEFQAFWNRRRFFD